MRSGRTRRGLTLIEVLIAMVIATVALLVTSGVIVEAQTATIRGDYTHTAASIASDKIASLEAGGYSALVDGTTTYNESNAVPDGLMTVTIGPLGGNSNNTNIKQIDITITWDGGSGSSNRGGNISASTLISAP